MKTKILTILFFLFSLGLFAQNLVPNPSFEEYDTCPNYISQVDYLKYWRNYRASPDYYNSCSNSNYVSVPYNIAVYQCPANGNAYCGFYAYSSLSNYREYIGVKLNVPLIENYNYYVSAKFNLTNSSNCAINNIGFIFTKKPYSYTNPLPTTNKSHIFTQNIISDTIDWITISGSFLADSTYEYISIGNFYCDSMTFTDTLYNYYNKCLSYYLVDDVCVSIDSLTCNLPNGTNICETGIAINEKDKNTDIVIFIENNIINIINENNEQNIIYFSMFDIIGRLIKKEIFDLNNTSFDISNLKKGVYILNLKYKNKIYINKIIKI